MKTIKFEEAVQLLSGYIGCVVNVVQVMNGQKEKSQYFLYEISNHIALYDGQNQKLVQFNNFLTDKVVIVMNEQLVTIVDTSAIGFQFDTNDIRFTKAEMDRVIKQKPDGAVEKSILRKVKKLLALSQNNSSEEEAQSALLKAQAIMAEHGLSSAEIEDFATETTKKEVVQDAAGDVGKTMWYEKRLASVIGDNFRCYTFTRHQRGLRSSYVVFMGLKEDVELAKSIYAFALGQMLHLCQIYVQDAKIDGTYDKGTKNSFILGFIDGLEAKFKEQVDKNNWGLVLVKDALVEQQHAKMKFRRSSSSSIHTSDSDKAYGNGYTQGKNFESRGSRKMIR